MKRKVALSLLVVFSLYLIACSQEGSESSKEKKIKSDVTETELQKKELTNKDDKVTIQGYVASEQWNAYGEITLLLTIDNSSEQSVAVSETDFFMQFIENETNLYVTAPPEVMTIEPGDSENLFVYYNVEMLMYDEPNSTFNLEDYLLFYDGDNEMIDKQIEINPDFPDEYKEIIIAELSQQEEAAPEIESTEDAFSDRLPNSDDGLVITLYELDSKGSGAVRVENKSNKSITYDATKLRVFDDVTEYELRKNVYDSAFDPVITLQPGEWEDYHEFFKLDNHLDESVDDIAGNIIGVSYTAPYGDYIMYGHYIHGEEPEDFGDESE